MFRLLMVIMSNAKQDVRTLYSLDEENPVLVFSNLVFKNEEVIIWKAIVDEVGAELCIARLDNLNDAKHVTCSDDYVVLEEQRIMFFHNQGKVMSLSFDDLLVRNVTNYFGRFLTFLNTGYVVSSLGDGKIKIKNLKDESEYMVHYEGSLANINGKVSIDTYQVIRKINEFCQEEIPTVSVETNFTSLELFASSNMFVYKESVECHTFKNGRKCTLNKVVQLKIDTEAITQYDFVSPDGRLYADTRLEEYIEYYNLIEERVVTKDEYNALKDNFGYGFGFDKESMVNSRKRFCLQHFDFFK